MKNLFLLSTDKPSRVYLENNGKYGFRKYYVPDSMQNIKCVNIYITNDEEIKEGDWCISLCDDESYEEIYQCKDVDLVDEEDKKIILTTDDQLIQDGVQAIDDEFLEWFVKNPSCEEVEVYFDLQQLDQTNPVLKGTTSLFSKYKIIIPIDETEHLLSTNTDKEKLLEDVNKQETTIEEVAEIFVTNRFTKQICNDEYYPDIYASKASIVESHVLFAKWQQEQSNENVLHFEIDALKRQIKVLEYNAKNLYSEEEVLQLLQKRTDYVLNPNNILSDVKKWFEQFSKLKNGESI